MLAFILLSACGRPLDEEAAKNAVSAAFQAANPPGRTGLEIKGKGVWYATPHFDKSCLEKNDLAFNDDPATRPASAGGMPRISPTYQNQRWVTASTNEGFCIYLGSDPKIEVGAATWMPSSQEYKVETVITMGEPSPWFSCLEGTVKNRLVIVGHDDGTAKVTSDVSLHQGACPNPMPEGTERKGGNEPVAAAPKAPTAAQIETAVRNFDDKIWEGDLVGALGAINCYNVFENPKYGTCSVAEIIAAGPHPRGEQRAQDGTPWTQYAIADLSDFGGKTVKDSKNPSMYHVLFKHKRTGSTKSITVQYTGGVWKLVGFVGMKGEGFTTAQFIYDLHDKDRRDVFERRLQGEQIDEKGDPYDPWAEMREEQ